jgi:NitT/TauT family transport system substrate-binding protein
MFFCDRPPATHAARWTGPFGHANDHRDRRLGVLGRRVHFWLAAIAVFLTTGPVAAQTGVKVSLDWRFEGPAAPFLLALDRGYYKAEGLDVSIEPGANSLEPITRLAAGNFDIAVGDINALIKLRDQNPNTAVKAVFIVYDRPPYAVIGRRSRGIVHPKDLEGRKLGAPAADSSAAQWPLFARVANIDPAKVTVENVGIPVREPMVAAGQVDAITGFSFSTFIGLKDRGVPTDDIVVMLMADHGLDLYGNAIMVNTKFAAEKPEAVKGFLSAFTKALKETVRSPTASIEPVLRRNELAKKDVELERLRMAIRDNILTPQVRTHGYGAIATDRFEQAVEQIALVYKFKSKPGAADIFDGSFLPPASERRVH